MREKLGMQQRWPEHRKLEVLGGKNETVGQFIEWLEQQGLVIAEHHVHTDECDRPRDERKHVGRACGLFGEGTHSLYRWEPPGQGNYIARIVALYFGIDADALEREKQQMLEQLRGMQQS